MSGVNDFDDDDDTGGSDEPVAPPRPSHDPNMAAEHRSRRAFEVLQTLPEWARRFGAAVVLPNWEGGFAEGVRTHKKQEKK